MSTDFESNMKDAEQLLQRFRGETLPHFINGKRDPGRSGNTFDSIAPSDNSVIGSVSAGNADTRPPRTSADLAAARRARDRGHDNWSLTLLTS